LDVFVCDIFNEEQKAIALRTSAKGVLCNQVITNLPEGWSVFDANEYRIPGTWYAWNKNLLVVDSLGNKFPKLLEAAGINLKNTMLKTLIWSNRKQGYLFAGLEQLNHLNPINKPELYYASKWKLVLKYLRLKFSAGNVVKRTPSVPLPDKRFGILVEDQFEMGILQPVAEALGRENIVWVLPPFHRFKSAEIDRVKQAWTCWIAPSSGVLHLPSINVLRCNKQETFCLNAWMTDLKPISDALYWGSLLFQSDVKVLVTLAQENCHIGHVLCALAAKSNKKVVNTMNGIKSGEAISARAEFDAWIVWDEQMKQLLHNEVKIPLDQMIVAGGLQQDAIAAHTYSNTIPLSEMEMNEKRIVSIISAKDLRIEKVEAIQEIYRWAAGQKDVMILYRPHPLEKDEAIVFPASGQEENVRFIRPEPAISKNSLMDQLMLSDLVVCFGSTVALESKWMGTPCITYEKKPVSDLYCVDGQHIKHVNSLGDLKELLRTLNKNKELNKHIKGKSDIALRYASIIQSYA